MIAFWVVAGVLSAAAAGLILLRAAGAARRADAPDPTPVLYRRQLAEIDELADRGLIGQGERKAAHAEAARRLLSAAEHPGAAWEPGAKADRWVMAAVLIAPLLALGLYFQLGAPGFPDQPFEKRTAAWKQAGVERLKPAELAAVLEQLARTRPNDPELQRYIGLSQSAAQNPAAAVRALRKAVTLAPERADLWTTLGEALVFRDGEVGEEAEAAFRESLKRDPKGMSARFYLAQARIVRGDKAGGLADWRALLADMAPDDQRRPLLIEAIAQAEARPDRPTFRGDEMAAIRGMVAGLAERLKANPEDPEGWVRLVRAYAVLGEVGPRDAALKEARARFATKPDILNQLAQAAAAEPMK